MHAESVNRELFSSRGLHRTVKMQSASYTLRVVRDFERLGILGGTFDPVHTGHLVAALEARNQLDLDRVLLVVAGDPWQKQGTVVAPAAARYEMVAAAIAGLDGLQASRIEVDREGPTYTIDTVEALAGPGRRLFLVVGADVATRLDGWHRADDLRQAVTIAVVTRGDDEAPVVSGWNAEAVTMPRLDISSTEIRRRIPADAPIDGLVPPGAVRVIRSRRLYTAGE
jgi:nicotinate-nucleotide adenylyltransferase